MKTILYPSPVGPLTLVSDGEGLVGISMHAQKHLRAYDGATPGADAVIDETRRQLDAYFAGKRRAFDLKLAPRGTPFQQKVWAALTRIPFGATRSYGQIAVEIGAPAAVRAVGAANGRNPVAIVIPCHRVIGANGTLTGYAGGLERKTYLLALERGEPAILCA